MSNRDKDRLEVRFKPILTAEDRETLDRYLESATLFWNCCVFHLESRAKRFVEEPISDESWLSFINDAKDFFINLKTAFLSPKETSAIDKSWIRFLPKIFELDDELLGNRLNDYVISCRSSKRNQGKVVLPQRKNERSAESIRFNPAHYVIQESAVCICRPKIMRIQIPDNVTVNLKEGIHYTVAVRRRMNHMPSRFGPVERQDSASYVVTILERSKNSMFKPQQ